MSVIVSQRGKQTFGVITKAIKLAEYTVKICVNEKNFPKKYRWIFTKEIIVETLHIVTNIRKAYSSEKNKLYDDAYHYQIEANGACESLLTLIEVAWGVLSIPSSRIEYWTGLIIDVEEALADWVDNDK